MKNIKTRFRNVKTIQHKQQKQPPDIKPKGKLHTCKSNILLTQMAGKGLPSLIHKELLRINKKTDSEAEDGPQTDVHKFGKEIRVVHAHMP